MKNILIVVDIQNGFIRYDQTKELAKKIIHLVDSEVFDSVVATRFLNHEGSQYIKFLNWHRLLEELNDGSTPSHVFLCGADTDCCVLKTSTDLFEKGIMPIVLTDYCNSNGGPNSHEAGLLVMGRLIGKKSIVPGEIHSREDLDKIIAERQY